MSTSVGELLGGDKVLGMPVDSNLDLAKATHEGLRSTAAILLAREILEIQPIVDVGLDLGADTSVVCAGVMPLHSLGVFGALIGSLAHHGPRRLTLAESDLVVRTATALSNAIGVFGEKTKAVHWLKSPNRARGGQTPLSLLGTSAGEREVEALLDRIEYGVYS